MRIRTLASLLLAGALLAAVLRARAVDAPTAFDPARSDPRAVAIADQVMEALGGRPAWTATRYLRFDFAVESEGKTVSRRAHTWDKHAGRYRVEGKTKEGDPFLVLMNVNSREGAAWLKGARVHGDDEKKQLERGYAMWVNDTYWLLMPYKMKDAGVMLAYGGEEKGSGGGWDKVVLTFDNVGLTPKDKYWAFVNRQTRLVDRWEYILKGGPGPASAWAWKNWKRYGQIMLSDDRVNPKDNSRIFFPVLAVPEGVPDAVFTSPEAAAPSG